MRATWEHSPLPISANALTRAEISVTPFTHRIVRPDLVPQLLWSPPLAYPIR
jgi:hypothetical protein